MKLAQLKTMYDFYNKTIFNDRLVKDVKFAITGARKYYGAALCYYEGDGNNTREYKIHFAKAIERSSHPLVTYKTIMLHEMIHVFQYMTYPLAWVKAKGEAGHDKVFYNWLDMIEYEHGIPMYRDFEK
jgi:hypothetical protein